MKQVKLVYGKGGRVKILADGAKGKGTEQFTMNLAKGLGRIIERHRGPIQTHTHQKAPKVEVTNK